MDEIATQRVRRDTKGFAEKIDASVHALFAAVRRAPSTDAIETLFKVELARQGLPIHADVTDPVFLIGYIIGRMVSRGATQDQVLTLLSASADESVIMSERVIPNCELYEQQRWERMLHAQIWELFYAIEETSGMPAENAPDAEHEAASSDKWEAAVRVATFVVEFQMLTFRL